MYHNKQRLTCVSFYFMYCKMKYHLFGHFHSIILHLPFQVSHFYFMSKKNTHSYMGLI
ncbi:hypothetical protein Hanom_Chr00s174527g01830041 [Helianthus anomalus]